ncbi:hypothetical protein GCM10009733_021460 [Nonomuraea maheshkhaliensis]|uniref:Secreted protein n=1 Tax=Nonomuraea maheshkhaliensis TaxID=419590 RepID=A0ABP4QVC7_9ACTN
MWVARHVMVTVSVIVRGCTSHPGSDAGASTVSKPSDVRDTDVPEEFTHQVPVPGVNVMSIVAVRAEPSSRIDGVRCACGDAGRGRPLAGDVSG